MILLLTGQYNRLSKAQLEILNDKTNNYLLSQASQNEMAIKLRLGKLGFDLSDVVEYCRECSIRMLNLEILHFALIDKVPKVTDDKGKPHDAPFFRLTATSSTTQL